MPDGPHAAPRRAFLTHQKLFSFQMAHGGGGAALLTLSLIASLGTGRRRSGSVKTRIVARLERALLLPKLVGQQIIHQLAPTQADFAPPHPPY